MPLVGDKKEVTRKYESMSTLTGEKNIFGSRIDK